VKVSTVILRDLFRLLILLNGYWSMRDDGIIYPIHKFFISSSVFSTVRRYFCFVSARFSFSVTVLPNALGFSLESPDQLKIGA
jgi:hypothetical protein